MNNVLQALCRWRPVGVGAAAISLGVTALCLAPVTAADDTTAVQADWRQPFHVTLPQPARQIHLEDGVEAAAWAQRHALVSYRTVYRSRHGSILETAMSDADWQAFSQRACTDDAVRCETAACQSIQFEGDAAPPGSGGAEAVQARMIRVPPEGPPVADQPDAEAQSCQAPPPALTDAASLPGADITVDLKLGGGPGADRGAAGSATGSESDAAADSATGSATDAATGSAAAAGQQSFEFAVERGINALGGASLDAASVPADSSDWSLVVSAGCSDVTVPLDALEPARVPGQITALVQAGAPAAVAASFGMVVLREIDLDSSNETLAVFAGVADVAATSAAMLLDPRVSAAQPEFVYRTAADYAATGPAAIEAPGYSDPFAALSYGPRLTGVLGLHPSATGAGLLVAVIDTGIATDHVDLVGRIRDTVDVTDRGWSADLHGTAVAGIIAANANNAEGSFGVAPGAEILAIKACQPVAAGSLRAKCWTSTLVKALDLAMSREATLINMSLAGPPDELVARYVALATGADRLVVAASGNNGPQGRPAYPAALPGVLAVTAIDAAERRYPDANIGDYIDVAAPGVDIISPAPDGSYPALSGTSMAAAHVSGAAALLKELVPLSGGAELAAVLRSQTRDLGATGADAEFGTGLLDACRAATQATADAVACAMQGDSHGQP